MDAYSNILYVKECFAALSFLAHQAVLTDLGVRGGVGAHSLRFMMYSVYTAARADRNALRRPSM